MDVRDSISIIIPALNEEAFIGRTLEQLKVAVNRWGGVAEVIVVDNDSSDRTSLIASEFGARVIHEAQRNISKARNRGAMEATGAVVFFLDADTLLPEETLEKVAEVIGESDIEGGAIDLLHEPAGLLLGIYFSFWRVFGRWFGMAQGAAQFYRREEFLKAGGFDETIFMGEDVECFQRIASVAKKGGRRMKLIDDVQAIPSTRRFDQWPLWKTLVDTNPLFIRLLWKRKKVWGGWYDDVPRSDS